MSKPQVIIVRKDKRVRHKFLHALAFGLTGGLSGFVTAAEVTSHAGYNARTRKLQERSGTPERESPASSPRGRTARQERSNADILAGWRAEHVPSSREYRERHPGA